VQSHTKRTASRANTVVGFGLLVASVSCSAQPQVSAPAEDIGILHVRGSVYMLVGAYSNTTVQVGEQGILVVDTMTESEGDRLLAAIQGLSDQPIRHVINTHAHPDHIGSNLAVALAGDGLFNRNASINVNTPDSDPASGSAPIYAHENALNAISAMEPSPPFDAWPSSTYFTDSKDLFFNGEAVRLFHQPNAHTDGDSIVQFRGSDVISTGDIFVTTGYPFIDVDNGGSIEGVIAGLNRVIEIAVPEALQEGGTLIVPGRGRLCDESEVVEYRDMLTIIRSIIQERIDEGMTLTELQAARPTLGFDARYGSDSGAWTTEQFVAAIYDELTRGSVE
jgi:glyoxylase-like metal-dependent hydrolase (beta-lactamase superfamily II)